MTLRDLLDHYLLEPLNLCLNSLPMWFWYLYTGTLTIGLAIVWTR
jgi:hypothetical protein